ncbi:hypothetical protein PanWU01x14_132890 [Parasponia andersonii]|uniref:Uncharacterized protein n=1 Tax=Parasponia andersonii TaxID=3476 RepID=A0A2P5CQ93_PARAD|nr:hypothetical protein PanWU01x14_132890 [Parasponia andersonii]
MLRSRFASMSYPGFIGIGKFFQIWLEESELVTKSPINPEVPVKNAFSILKKDLGEEIQNPGEPLTGKRKIWADDVEENLEVEDQAIRRNNDEEILLNAEDQHNNSTMLDVERDLDQGKEQG